MHVDNLGCCYNLISGHSNCKLTAAIVNRIFEQDKQLCSGSYFRYINTLRNIADPLTRLEKMFLLLDNFPEIHVNYEVDKNLLKQETDKVMLKVKRIKRFFKSTSRKKANKKVKNA